MKPLGDNREGIDDGRRWLRIAILILGVAAAINMAPASYERTLVAHDQPMAIERGWALTSLIWGPYLDLSCNRTDLPDAVRTRWPAWVDAPNRANSASEYRFLGKALWKQSAALACGTPLYAKYKTDGSFRSFCEQQIASGAMTEHEVFAEITMDACGVDHTRLWRHLHPTP